MNKQLRWKLAIVVAVALVSVYSIFQYGISLGLDLKGGTSFLLRMDLSQIDQAGRGQAIQQAIEILRKRIDKFGVAEPIIQPMGGDRILVQLPGLDEQRRTEAQHTIEQTAYLEFRLVDAKNDQDQAELLSDPSFTPPLGYTNMALTETRGGQPTVHKYFVKIRPEMTGKYLQRAFPQMDQMGSPYIAMQFTDEGARVFARVVGANANRLLAIVLDGEIQSAPVIQPKLAEDARADGSVRNAQITGTFTLDEARAAGQRAGESVAGAGEDARSARRGSVARKGLDPQRCNGGRDWSDGRGRVHGGVLPGGGLGRQRGVGVEHPDHRRRAGDVQIHPDAARHRGHRAQHRHGGGYQRADLRARPRGAGGQQTVAGRDCGGYERAFRVIFDAHFTAILTAIILIYHGQFGPVKGFGVTLVIGLLANLFSGVFVTRMVFDWLVAKRLDQIFHDPARVPSRAAHQFPRRVEDRVCVVLAADRRRHVVLCPARRLATLARAKCTESISKAATRGHSSFAQTSRARCSFGDSLNKIPAWAAKAYIQYQNANWPAA